MLLKPALMDIHQAEERPWQGLFSASRPLQRLNRQLIAMSPNPAVEELPPQR